MALLPSLSLAAASVLSNSTVFSGVLRFPSCLPYFINSTIRQRLSWRLRRRMSLAAFHTWFRVLRCSEFYNSGWLTVDKRRKKICCLHHKFVHAVKVKFCVPISSTRPCLYISRSSSFIWSSSEVCWSSWSRLPRSCWHQGSGLGGPSSAKAETKADRSLRERDRATYFITLIDCQISVSLQSILYSTIFVSLRWIQTRGCTTAYQHSIVFGFYKFSQLFFIKMSRLI